MTQEQAQASEAQAAQAAQESPDGGTSEAEAARAQEPVDFDALLADADEATIDRLFKNERIAKRHQSERDSHAARLLDQQQKQLRTQGILDWAKTATPEQIGKAALENPEVAAALAQRSPQQVNQLAAIIFADAQRRVAKLSRESQSEFAERAADGSRNAFHSMEELGDWIDDRFEEERATERAKKLAPTLAKQELERQRAAEAKGKPNPEVVVNGASAAYQYIDDLELLVTRNNTPENRALLRRGQQDRLPRRGYSRTG